MEATSSFSIPVKFWKEINVKNGSQFQLVSTESGSEIWGIKPSAVANCWEILHTLTPSPFPNSLELKDTGIRWHSEKFDLIAVIFMTSTPSILAIATNQGEFCIFDRQTKELLWENRNLNTIIGIKTEKEGIYLKEWNFGLHTISYYPFHDLNAPPKKLTIFCTELYFEFTQKDIVIASTHEYAYTNFFVVPKNGTWGPLTSQGSRLPHAMKLISYGNDFLLHNYEYSDKEGVLDKWTFKKLTIKEGQIEFTDICEYYPRDHIPGFEVETMWYKVATCCNDLFFTLMDLKTPKGGCVAVFDLKAQQLSLSIKVQKNKEICNDMTNPQCLTTTSEKVNFLYFVDQKTPVQAVYIDPK